VTELRRGPTVGVSPWHGRRAARRPCHGRMRGGGGIATGSGDGGRKGKGARPGGPARPARPVQGQMAIGLEKEINFEFDFQL
jgi:hypothetical protein